MFQSGKKTFDARFHFDSRVDTVTCLCLVSIIMKTYSRQEVLLLLAALEKIEKLFIPNWG